MSPLGPIHLVDSDDSGGQPPGCLTMLLKLVTNFYEVISSWMRLITTF